MTTIAWDGKVLAADRLADQSGTKRAVRKLFDCGCWLYAGAGSLPLVHLVAEWLGEGAHRDKTPKVDKELAGIVGIAVKKSTGKAFVLECVPEGPIVFVPIEGPHAAVGSGKDAAYAALKLGFGAKRAVEVASEIDVCTGLGVDWVDVKARTKRTKGLSQVR